MGFISKLLEHPATHRMLVDDPRTTEVRRNIIQEKVFLRQLYFEWYQHIQNALPTKTDVLELGSGPGFLKQFIPELITSEVFPVSDVDLVADAACLPIKDDSLNAIVMVDVLHHLPDVRGFFREGTRCIRSSGKLLMIEPWNTKWSRWIFTNFHNEPFKPDAGWEIASTGPLSGANGALPWIIFHRDRTQFEDQFPSWEIKQIKLMMPTAYLLSGGVSMRALMPGFMYRPIRFFERRLNPEYFAMFALIELELVD